MHFWIVSEYMQQFLGTLDYTAQGIAVSCYGVSEFLRPDNIAYYNNDKLLAGIKLGTFKLELLLIWHTHRKNSCLYTTGGFL